MTAAYVASVVGLLVIATLLSIATDDLYSKGEEEIATGLMMVAVLCVIAATVLAVKLMGMM